MEAAKKHFGYKYRIKIQSQVTRAESCGQVALHFTTVQNNAQWLALVLDPPF